MNLGIVKHLAPAFADNGPSQWEIKARPDVMMRLKKALPKVEVRRAGSVLLSDTPENAREITWILERWDLELTDADRGYLERRTTEHFDHKAAVTRILSGERESDDWQEPADHVDEYQYQAAELAMKTGGLIVTDELAMGKTYTSLLMLRNPEALPALIVVQSHLTRQWQKQLEELLPWLRSHIIRTGAVYDPSKKRGMHGYHPDVLISTYMKLAGWADHLAGEVKTVIFDECQELRRAEAAKTTAAGQITDGAKFCMGLSGTPVFNFGGEAYNILDVIRPGCLGEREEFAREWGVSSGDKIDTKFEGGHLKVRARELGTYLHEEGLLLHRTWEEVGRERPEQALKIPHTIEAETDLIEEATSDAKALAELILSKATTQQEVFAAERDLDNKIRQATGVAKAPYVADFVRMLLEGEEKVVVWAWHRAVYAILNAALEEFKPIMYTGSESDVAKRRAEEVFIKGDARVLLMSLRSGAGLDGLQEACNTGVFAELDWAPPIHDQCLGRLPRPGQKKPVVGYYLLTESGSDPGLVELLDVKRMQSEPIRNPKAELFEPTAQDPSDRIKQLAESVLERRAVEVAA